MYNTIQYNVRSCPSTDVVPFGVSSFFPSLLNIIILSIIKVAVCCLGQPIESKQ